MAYITEERIKARIPGPILIETLDDDADGVADDGMLAQIIAAADNAVDALISPKYSTPRSTPEPMVIEASFAFACEMIYDRRRTGERNPFRASADDWRKKMERVGLGTLLLSPEDTVLGTGPAFNAAPTLVMGRDNQDGA